MDAASCNNIPHAVLDGGFPAIVQRSKSSGMITKRDGLDLPVIAVRQTLDSSLRVDFNEFNRMPVGRVPFEWLKFLRFHGCSEHLKTGRDFLQVCVHFRAHRFILPVF